MPTTKIYATEQAWLKSYVEALGTSFNPSFIAQKINAEPEKYGRDPTWDIAPSTVSSFHLSGKATSRTIATMRNFLAIEAPKLAPTEKLPSVSLDLTRFFGSDEREVARYRSLGGVFQTYSRSLRQRIRRGRIEFDVKHDCICVRQWQVADVSPPSPELAIGWNGFAVVRGGYFFAVLRMDEDAGGATPLFMCFYPRDGLLPGAPIEILIGQSLSFRGGTMHFNQTNMVMRRMPAKDIQLDICESEEAGDLGDLVGFLG